MQGAKSEPNLGIIVKQGSVNNGEEYLDENKENFAPDQFDDHSIKYLNILFLFFLFSF